MTVIKIPLSGTYHNNGGCRGKDAARPACSLAEKINKLLEKRPSKARLLTSDTKGRGQSDIPRFRNAPPGPARAFTFLVFLTSSEPFNSCVAKVSSVIR